MSRGGSKISRDRSFSSYSTEEPSWAEDYFKAVEKYSVKSKKEDALLFDQINQILGNSKSKYSSVEEAVLDMQRRTGLLDILEKRASEEDFNMFEMFPDLKDFIKTKLEVFPGSSVSAIVDQILVEPKYKNALPPGEPIPSEVEEYINNLKSKSISDEDDSVDARVDLDIDTGTLRDNDPLKVLTPSSF